LTLSNKLLHRILTMMDCCNLPILYYEGDIRSLDAKISLFILPWHLMNFRVDFRSVPIV
jgi:hypothetical protein